MLELFGAASIPGLTDSNQAINTTKNKGSSPIVLTTDLTAADGPLVLTTHLDAPTGTVEDTVRLAAGYFLR